MNIRQRKTFTHSERQEIRKLAETMNQADVARLYGIKQQDVSEIVKGIRREQ